MAKQKKEGFSNAFRDATEGFLTDHNVIIKDAYYCLWEEAGEQALQGGREADDVCLTLEFASMEDPEEVFRPERIGAGKGSSVAPSEDGESPSKRGPFLCRSNDESKARGLSKQSGAYAFIKSCIKPPEGKLKLSEAAWDEQGCDALIGMSIHYVVVPDPGAGENRKKRLCQEVLELAEKGAAKKAKAASKVKKDEDEDAEDATGEAQEGADNDDEGDDDSDASSTAETIVAAIIEKAGGPVKKDDLTKKSFTAMAKVKDKKVRSEILELMQDDEWLGDDDRPWQFNAKKGVLTGVE